MGVDSEKKGHWGRELRSADMGSVCEGWNIELLTV
jgi:hypothetical protein